jgi:methenyltetrahydromethanopterin cyclohydrolase
MLARLARVEAKDYRTNQIVGYYLTSGSGPAQGFSLKKGVYSTILYPGSYATAAIGINTSGQVVGLFGV